jgi:hypothetical protein
VPDTDVTCLVCNQNQEVPEKYIGKNWRCPSCQTRFVPARTQSGDLTFQAIPGEALARQADAPTPRIATPAPTPAGLPGTQGHVEVPQKGGAPESNGPGKLLSGSIGSYAITLALGMIIGILLMKKGRGAN